MHSVIHNGKTVQDDVNLLAKHWQNFGYDKENAERQTDEQQNVKRATQMSDATRKRRLKQGAPHLERSSLLTHPFALGRPASHTIARHPIRSASHPTRRHQSPSLPFATT